jgi:hypothetical protein
MMNNKTTSLRRSVGATLSGLALLAGVVGGVQAAEPAYHWIPAGEAVGDEVAAPSNTSGTTRAAVEAEVLQARRSGELKQAGEASGEYEQRVDASRTSAVARSEVKAETLAAVRSGLIAPFGEAATFGAAPGGE